MPTFNSLFETELVKRVNEELVHLREMMEQPNAITGFEQYKLLLGQILQLNKILSTYIPEANKAVNER
jgi:hypothetical protein